MKFLILFSILFVLLSGCSSDQSQDEQGAIDKKTEQVATEMVQKIQQPIEKAKALQESEEQRTAKFKEQAE
jgi:PBP1b-binding outer membrane lipoprotein LpoB